MILARDEIFQKMQKVQLANALMTSFYVTRINFPGIALFANVNEIKKVPFFFLRLRI